MMFIRAIMLKIGVIKTGELFACFALQRFSLRIHSCSLSVQVCYDFIELLCLHRQRCRKLKKKPIQ